MENGLVQSGEFTDIEVVNESQLPHKTDKRLIAIVYEDQVTTLSREHPYQTSPGCFSSHYYSEQALARSPKFVMGTPAVPSEVDGLIAQNKELKRLNFGADQRVKKAADDFAEQLKEAAEKMKEIDGRRAAAEQGELSARGMLDDEIERRKLAEEAAGLAQKALREYKEKVAAVMLLVPSRGEMSVADLVEASDVGDIMGGEKCDSE